MIDPDGDQHCENNIQICPGGDDNCPENFNPNQENFDGDTQGNACDADDDGDGVLDGPDQCDPDGPNPTAAEDVDGVQDGEAVRMRSQPRFWS